MSTVQKKARQLPFLQGILPIVPSKIPVDIVAGITLAALGIPEVMGYTKIAGMPVITGLYTLVLPIAVFAILGSSRHLVVGADSATAAIMAAGLAGLATQDTTQYVALAGVLAIMTALFLIFARIVKLGFLANFLSRSVLIGFLTGVGIQVALGQVGGMLGVTTTGRGPIEKFFSAIQQIPQANVATVIISASVLIIIIGAGMINNKIPGALIAVVGSIIASYALNLSQYGVTVLGPVPSGLPPIGLPHAQLTSSEIPQLLTTAASIFIVILAQSAATSRAYAMRYYESFDENVDLIGLGMASIAAGISGTFVVNGSPTKTEMVVSAGGRSEIAQLTTAAIVIIVLLFLTVPLSYMPNCVLSSVVFLIGIRLIDIKGMRGILRVSPEEFIVATITAVTVVVVGVEQGIILAIVLSIVIHISHSYRPSDATLVPMPGGHWQTTAVTEDKEAEPGLVVYFFGASLYFANAVRFSEEIVRLVDEAQPQVKWLDVDAAAMIGIDYTGADTIRQIHTILEKKGVTLVFSNVIEDVRREIDRFGLTKLIGEEHIYDSLPDVLDAYRKENKQAETESSN
ncbi:MAG: SulP family inorganic anion transporter [Ktedonobacteraceae bacterium]